MPEHGEKVGVLDFFDWDIAAWKTIGGQFDTTKNELYMPLGFLVPIANPDPDSDQLVEVDRARIMFKKPEPTHMEMDLPLIVISRDDYTHAPQRESLLSEAYRVPAEGAVRVSAGGVLGWSAYEVKEVDVPIDFTYTYEVWARDRTIAQMMLQILMAKLPFKRGVMRVTDSLNNVRAYYFTMESTSDLTEVSSLVDRIAGFSMTIVVQGELTLSRTPVIGTAVTGATQDTPWTPGNGEAPDPGPGGLYGTGAANVTLVPMNMDAVIKRLYTGRQCGC